MISDFQQLSTKIEQLAELAHSLRRENAELRVSLASAAAENADLAKRIDEACQRVTSLLDKLPAVNENHEEAA